MARLLASAGLGVLVAHELAYALAEGIGGDVHGYLGYLAGLAVPLGLLAVVSLGLRSLRFDGPGPSVRRLAALQVALFGVQELTELLAAGGRAADLLHHEAFWLGVVLQPVVAWILVRAARAGIRLVRHTTGRARPPVAAFERTRFAAPSLPFVPAPAHLAAIRRRGPPVPVG